MGKIIDFQEEKKKREKEKKDKEDAKIYAAILKRLNYLFPRNDPPKLPLEIA